MDAIASQFRDLYSKADEDGRRKLQDELRDLQSSVDTEWDLVIRLASGLLYAPLVKIGADLHVFEKLTESDKPLTLEHLARESGAALSLLGHLLRAMAAFGVIKETGKDEFASNRTTKVLSNVHVLGALDHLLDVHSPVAQALPGYLAEKKYQMITSNKDLPFQKALNTDLTPFEWMKQHPEQMKSLGHAMAMQRQESWVDHYNMEKEVATFSPAADSALLVDVGGGFGQQAVAVKRKFPSLPGRIIVQDIPQTLDAAPPIEGIEFMVQDFFQPQQIRNAKFYYLRHILHDWTDEDCIRILKAIVSAMGPESRVVIDEVVLPNVNVPWQAAYMDLTMMGSLGGIERTKAEFETLLGEAGLKITEIKKYDPKMQSIIVAAPK